MSTTLTRTTRPFRASYPFCCVDCGQSGEAGSYACYHMGVLLHADCAGMTVSNREMFSSHGCPDDKPEPEPSYVVRGARNPPRCNTCHCEHVGECL